MGKIQYISLQCVRNTKSSHRVGKKKKSKRALGHIMCSYFKKICYRSSSIKHYNMHRDHERFTSIRNETRLEGQSRLGAITCILVCSGLLQTDRVNLLRTEDPFWFQYLYLMEETSYLVKLSASPFWANQ